MLNTNEILQTTFSSVIGMSFEEAKKSATNRVCKP